MHKPDLKKFITAFLVLGIAASAGAFLFSSARISRSADEGASGGDARGVRVGENVLVEPIPDLGRLAARASSSGIFLPAVRGNNLTDSLVRTLAQEIAAKGPSGANLVLTPDSNALDLLIEKNTAALAVNDLEDRTSYRDFKILSKYTNKEIGEFVVAVNTVLAKTVASPEYKELVNRAPSIEAARLSESTLKDAMRELEGVAVPVEYAKLHRNLISFLSAQATLVRIAAEYEADPVKAVVLADQNPKRIVEARYRDFDVSFKSAKFPEELSRGNGLRRQSPLSFIKKLFTLPIAFGQGFGVGVPIYIRANIDPGTTGYHVESAAATGGTWVQELFKWARKVGTEILKNQIVHTLVKQVIDWVKNDFEGKPRFVQDFGGFLGTAFGRAAGTVIDSLSPAACRNIGPIIAIALHNPPSLYDSIGCTLDRVEANLDRFYNRFEDGGWVSYSAAVNPSNNLFGTLIQGRDIALGAGLGAKEGQKLETQSSGGFLSIRRCDAAWPDGSHVPRDPVGAFGPELECSDGKSPKITSPAEITAENTKKAVASSPFDKVVNSDDIAALTSAIVDSFLNKLIKAGVNGITGAFNDDTTRVSTASRNSFSCDGINPATDPELFRTCMSVGDSGQFRSADQPTYRTNPYDTAFQKTTCTSTATPRCSEFAGDVAAQAACIDACFP